MLNKSYNFNLKKAKRSGITKIILPYENEKDFIELQDFIKEGMEVSFAKTYEDIFRIIFPSEAHKLEVN